MTPDPDVTHLIGPTGGSTFACCGASMIVDGTRRVTLDPGMVTCPGTTTS